MEKLKLTNNDKYDVVSVTDGAELNITVIPIGSIQDMYRTFSNEENVRKMVLETETGDVLRIFAGFTQLISITYTKDAVIGYDEEGNSITDNVITVVFKQPDRLQEQINELQSAVIELAGIIGGE